jgi:hypothetical protein
VVVDAVAGFVDAVGLATLGFDEEELGFGATFSLLEDELDAVRVLLERLNLSF